MSPGLGRLGVMAASGEMRVRRPASVVLGMLMRPVMSACSSTRAARRVPSYVDASSPSSGFDAQDVIHAALRASLGNELLSIRKPAPLCGPLSCQRIASSLAQGLRVHRFGAGGVGGYGKIGPVRGVSQSVESTSWSRPATCVSKLRREASECVVKYCSRAHYCGSSTALRDLRYDEPSDQAGNCEGRQKRRPLETKKPYIFR